MNDALAQAYPLHLATLRQRADAALEAVGRAHLVIPAGHPIGKHLDDMEYPFAVHPSFKQWVPLLNAPGSWIVYTPGEKPVLIYLQPQDFWHLTPEDPTGYWVEHFDIRLIRTWEDARQHLPKDPAACAILGQPRDGIADFVPDAPEAVVQYLNYHRAYKTPYEQIRMREASALGARGHRAAAAAFRAGESEFGIHMAYLHAVGQTDAELPYHSIAGLNEHGAVLHYMHFDTTPPERNRSFLIDAGASSGGYASDITRTYAAPEAEEFRALIDAVDKVQLQLCDGVRAGRDYAELHLQAHQLLAGVLKDQGIVDMSPEAMVERGVSSTFFPHGLGHGIGLQVHDVGGFMRSDKGGTIAQPDGHPFLRMTRALETDMVVTIEPGLYFIDMLLARLKERPEGKHVDWNRVDALRPYGGIRIEDDVICTDGDPENMTRDAFAALD
ncbi:Xaa-Pro dipeptidase [Oleiagrimonas soli]|uniref:Xaa-Pro dipeptidase n=1 Tax=Oleiagrimonas soli TaxID=1543381 RepID=A0A099CT52_9GAMM|nr:Xaa-Pro dipeptidase [Oleiagrimonas soli]KGI76861.1 proline dipeptidase [Oleiagrimonas soli]MBB6185283.1 Xaa-Pro dipeptidase [Oleiagrimonas soli]